MEYWPVYLVAWTQPLLRLPWKILEASLHCAWLGEVQCRVSGRGASPQTQES